MSNLYTCDTWEVYTPAPFHHTYSGTAKDDIYVVVKSVPKIRSVSIQEMHRLDKLFEPKYLVPLCLFF
jgi:hypothetical protein